MKTFLVGTIAVLAAISNCEGGRLRRQSISQPAPSISKRIVCYYQNWSVYRPNEQKFTPSDINPNLCTHIIYAYAKIEKGQEGLVSFDPEADIKQEGYKQAVDLKKFNPNLKVLIAAGGGREGTGLFSQIAANSENRANFIRSAIRFIRFYEFDGIELSWQWPGLWTGSTSSDRDNYVLFAQEMRDAIISESEESGNPQLIFSILSPKFEQEIIRGFKFDELSKYVDFFNVKSYGYHTSTEPTVHHIAPLYTLPWEGEAAKEFTIDNTVNYYAALGVDLDKINLAIPLYGISFFLADPEENDIGSPADEPGDGIEIGALWYNQICRRSVAEGWTIKHINRTAMGPYAYKDALWVAYDDEESVKEKGRFAAKRGIGGLAFWSIDFDDFRSSCHTRQFPMIKAASEAFIATEKEPFVSTLYQTPSADPVVTRPPRPTRPNPPPVTQAPIQLQTRPTPQTMRPDFTLVAQPVRPPTNVLSAPINPGPIIPASDVQRNEQKDEDNDVGGVFSLPQGVKMIVSRGDIFFQNIKMWVNNYFIHPSNIRM